MNKKRNVALTVLLLLASFGVFGYQKANGADITNIPSPKEICDNIIDDDGDKLVDAGDPDCYRLLAPLPGLTNVNTVQGLPPYIRTVFRLSIGIAGVIAVVMIVWSGIEYMLSDVVFDKKAAKARIWSAIGGIILLLGSVVILNTINPDLLRLGFQLDTVSVQVTDDDPSPVSATGMVCVGKGPQGKGYAVGADWATASGLPTATLPVGVTVKNSECAKVGDTNCTSTRGLDTKPLEIIKSKCPDCEVLVTGGTECWAHQTHGPGLSATDIRSTNAPNLAKYITGDPNFKLDGKVRTKDGIRFLAEIVGQTKYGTAEHWHVSLSK